MGSRPAIVRQKDVTRIIKGAAAAGVALGVIIRDGEARFVPVDELKPAAEPSALERFRAVRNASKARGHS